MARLLSALSALTQYQCHNNSLYLNGRNVHDCSVLCVSRFLIHRTLSSGVFRSIVGWMFVHGAAMLPFTSLLCAMCQWYIFSWLIIRVLVLRYYAASRRCSCVDMCCCCCQWDTVTVVYFLYTNRYLLMVNGDFLALHQVCFFPWLLALAAAWRQKPN